MKAQEIYKIALLSTDRFMKMYLSDFSDEDLLVRPLPNANHCAWQIGHFIKSEFGMLEKIRPGFSPSLPEGFAEQHAKTKSTSDNPADFLTKAAYMELYDKQRSATLSLIECITDEELEQPGPEQIRALAPTMGALLYMATTHPMLHVGQFTMVRRKLEKPILL